MQIMGRRRMDSFFFFFFADSAAASPLCPSFLFRVANRILMAACNEKQNTSKNFFGGGLYFFFCFRLTRTITCLDLVIE